MTVLPPPSDNTAPESPETTDAALLQAWAAQQCSADFTELVCRHIGLVRGIASRQLGEGHADDTTQTVFAILARKAPALTSVRSLSAWLHRVTMLQCRNAVRRLIRERRSQQAAMENALLSAARDPLADALPHLDFAINALGESDRQLILLRYSEGLTFAQAADRVGRSETALRQQAGRALETLATHLRRRGVAVPSAVLASGLGHVLCGTGGAEAAVLCGRAAIAAAQKLTAGTLAGITFFTMSTIQSILAGGTAALLLVAGPVIWRTQQISTEETAASQVRTPSPAGVKSGALGSDDDPVVAAAPSATSPAATTPAAAPPGNLLEDLKGMVTQEMKASFSEWVRRSAWLEARRTGRMLGLSPQKERELRKFVETQLMERVNRSLKDESSDGHQDRRDYNAKLEAWYAENLSPAQNTTVQRAVQSRKEALVERLAEDALHGISSITPLTEEQKTKLYNAAAAKASAQIAANDYGGSLAFGAAISPPAGQPLEESSADAIASVLDPAQLELWEQSREQERLFSDVFPRRMADRTLAAIRERGLGGAVMSLLHGALGNQ
jgi:RNA polymerase sigma factor (sigma-70 family)